jgi:hypothetical protein
MCAETDVAVRQPRRHAANDPAEFVVMWDRLASLLQAPDVRSEQSFAHEVILIEEFIPARVRAGRV